MTVIPWTNQAMTVYHGTTLTYAQEIEAGNISVARGKLHRDFGRGFYTTTVYRRARRWANIKAKETPDDPNPRVVEIILRREDLAALGYLAFVNGSRSASDLWSFIHYCRKGATDHGRIALSASGERMSYYDVVFGPIAADWERKIAMQDADQISFHTEKAEQVLNSASTRRIILT